MKKNSSLFLFYAVEPSHTNPNTMIKTKVNFYRDYPKKDLSFLKGAIEDIIIRELNFPPNSLTSLTESEFKEAIKKSNVSIFNDEHNVY